MGRARQRDFVRSARDVPCELCGERDFQVVGEKDRRGGPLTSVVCTVCGLVSHENLPSDNELAAYYARQYRSDYHGEFAPSPHRVIRAWRTGKRLLRQLRPFVGQKDRVLEIGAGIGCTVKAFATAGLTAEGIEPHQGFQRFAQRRLHAAVRRRSLADLSTEGAYDVVLLVHVIEHFNHPARELRRIARLLKPDGRLYVECPNIEAPHAAPGRLFHFAHVYNFTGVTLTMLAQRCGLKRVATLFNPRRPVIGQVFSPASSPAADLDPSSYERTIAALVRYDTFTYHARPCYLAARLQRGVVHLSDRVLARRRLAKILRQTAKTRPARGAVWREPDAACELEFTL